MRNKILISIFIFAIPISQVWAAEIDSDKDGLSDNIEAAIYQTDPFSQDSDKDGYADKTEIDFSYDPNAPEHTKIDKTIKVNLENQQLSYYLGKYLIDDFKISSGDIKHPTPPGEYGVLIKKPLVTYKGPGYYYPNTKWNIMFKKGSWGNFYIHGAYWHNNFGKRVSHGCVNVPYNKMEALYNWTDEKTKISVILK